MKRLRVYILLLCLILAAILPVACSIHRRNIHDEWIPLADNVPAENDRESDDSSIDLPDNTLASLPGMPENGRPHRVALILEGPISDMAWNTSAYQGLMKIKALGAETKFVENVPVSNALDAIRVFVENRFNVVFLASASYVDVALKAADIYPDTMFFILNSNINTRNVRSILIRDEDQAYLMGATAALMTETKKVAFIGGKEIQPILNAKQGFIQGVRDVDESVEVFAFNTNSFADVNAAKELASVLIARGADIVVALANQSSLGVFDAVNEHRVWTIGAGPDQQSLAPDLVLLNVIKDISLAVESAFRSYSEGKLPESFESLGAKDGIIRLDKYMCLSVPEEIAIKIREIAEDLAEGRIEIVLD